MKVLNLLLFSLLLASQIEAQKKDFEFEKDEVATGKSFATNSILNANCIRSTKDIYSFSYDSLSNSILILTQKFGDNKQLTIINGQQPICSLVYNSYYERIATQKGLLFYVKKNGTTCMDLRNGAVLWNLPFGLYLSNSKSKIGIAYDQPGYFSNLKDKKFTISKGIDLTNGKIIWERPIGDKYDWENFKTFTDSTMYICSQGLHCLNIKNGTGWDINDITRVDLYTHNLNSRVFIDSTQSFWASNQNLWCFTNNGNIEWKQPLAWENNGESTIFKSDSLYYLLSFGSAHNDQNQDYAYGHSYLAQFSSKTKSINNFVILGNDDDYVRDYSIKHDTVFLCWPQKIAQYRLKNLSLIKEQKIQQKARITDFASESIYVLDKDQTYKSLKEIDSSLGLISLISKDKTVVSYDSNLNYKRCIAKDELASLIFKDKRTKVLQNESKIIVVDNEGKSIAEVNTENPALFRNKMVLYKDRTLKRLCIVDLTQYIN